MATSFHVYDTYSTYKKRYLDKVNSIYFSTDIKDCYIVGEHIWIVTNTNLEKERPELNRTIVHFRNNDISNYVTGEEKLIKYEESRYNPKNDHLEFCTRKFRKPLFSTRIGRFHGDKPKKPVKLNWAYRFYDITSDRVNLVLNEKV
ncbi:MAG: hypothetical protein H8D92_00055 [Pelagibacteraceae bacterium]|nr:hypothetical protein [Pelagibacteraceae bacterium]